MSQQHTMLNAGNKWHPHAQRVIKLQVHWSPGHMNFGPNERADKLAKEAAMGLSSPPGLLLAFLQTKPLPLSIHATCQADLVATQVIWKCHWKKSTHAPIHILDRTLPSKSYIKLIELFVDATKHFPNSMDPSHGQPAPLQSLPSEPPQ
ncbi:hypothetical protein C0995_002578 [Termitomyces sp. Mi166|nr:hypothetical protein C0995_002578 [Termitomyces sp. Mi166\